MEKGMWQHLFVTGEYLPPKQILAGLTLEQVNRNVSESSHSVYGELWHATGWQDIVVRRDEERYRDWQLGDLYPAHDCPNLEAWHTLADRFLVGLDEALEWTSLPAKLKLEVDPGVTMEDTLLSLAVHNAYHLGKIVAIRQAMGVWPPPGSEQH
ncbi:MAG: hypothetical protein WD314_01900 [Trueperaceae bacterium]